MNRLLELPDAVEQILRPETVLERALLTVPAFRFGMLWGEPRFGHPEGKVVLHVREVLDNIDRLAGLSPVRREQLRLIAFAHDTFKYAEDRSRPRDWSRHHGMLARHFLENYTKDKAVLDITEAHDEAFYVWRQEKHLMNEQIDQAGRSLNALVERMEFCLQTYYLFFKCDTRTGDKTQAPIKWFEDKVRGIEKVDL